MKMRLRLKISLILSGLSVLTAYVRGEESAEKCPYKDTVDLSDQVPFDNGSYLYHDILIDDTKLANYDYRLGFRNEEEPAETHVRGCVCGNGKYCVKLCCERGEFFNETSYECEPIPEDLNMPTDLFISMESDDERRNVNIFEYFIYQTGRPCKYPETLTMDVDRWELMEDGLLYIHNDGAYLDTVSYCLTPYRYNGTDEYVLVPMSCPIKNEITFSLLLNTYAMAISVVFLIPTVMVYLWLKELRGNMRGKLLICYLISLIIGYSIISFINISDYIFDEQICSILGFVCYYFFMAAFLWLSVLCIDIWINFKEHSVDFSNRKNRIRFIWYSFYSWGIAALLTIFTMWSQWSDWVSEIYKPGIGIDVCWLDTEKWAAAIYFYWPNLIILIFNMITFGRLTFRIYTVRRDLAKMTQKQKFFQENAVVILRLFIIMGICWIMDILSYCLRNYPEWEFLFILTDFCNAIQGVLIFVLFVLKRNVFDAIRKSCSPAQTRKPRRSVSSITTQFSKLSTSSTANA